MSTILDGLMVATIAYFVFVSYKLGVVKSTLSVASLVVSYGVAALFSPVAAGFIQKANIVDLFTKNMSAALTQGDAVLPGLGAAGGQFVDEFTAMTGTGELLDTSLELAEMMYSQRVTSILGFIIVFFLATTAIRIAINVLDLAAKLPVLNSINGFFGLLFGLVEGVIMCYAVCIVVSLLALLLDNPFGVLGAVPQTTVFKFFFNNNLLTAFLPWKI